MPRKFVMTSALLACASTAMAQECAVPAPVCAPQCSVPCAPRSAPASAPAEDERFVRGPAAGATTGESNTFGLRGLVIRIPEIRLQLPSIEMPSPYKIRHDAFKVFDEIRSPLVRASEIQEFDNVGPRSAPAAAPAQPATVPVYVPYSAPACAAPPVQCTELEQTLKALQSQLARLEVLEQELQQVKQQQVAAAQAPTTTWRPANVAPAAPAPRRGLETASYEEFPVIQESSPLVIRPTFRPAPESSEFGLPTPISNFGEWSNK